MQTYLGGGGNSPYAAQCGGNVAACVVRGIVPSATEYAQQIQTYTHDLTYGLPSVGDTTLPPVVPPGAYALIATRFPLSEHGATEPGTRHHGTAFGRAAR